ncbi:MAG: nucleoside permease [Pseudomonadota bacterium]
MNTSMYARLSTLMFLQFFVWGAWFVTLGTYLSGLGFSGTDIGSIYLTNNLGAIIAPFAVGLIADRYFDSEKVVAVMHLVGAGILYYASTLNSVGEMFFWLLLYNSAYMSTLALANSISFGQLQNPDTQFPTIRVWGTVGWIIAGLTISFVLGASIEGVEATSAPILMAALGSLLLGVYAFTLPHTPPPARDANISLGEIVGVRALTLFKDRSFAIFAVASLLICIPLAFYYSFANLYLNELGMTDVAAKMTLGQISEVVFMVAMPFFFRRLGVKWMLLIGMLAWVVRYAAFAYGSLDLVGLLYLGILLHGICYDFFFVTGQIYIDQRAGAAMRASAQGFITLLTYGAGMAIGTYAAGLVVDSYVVDGGHDWQTIWLLPCIFAAAVTVLFSVFFNEAKKDTEMSGVNA